MTQVIDKIKLFKKLLKLCHIRGEKQALNQKIELELDQQIADISFLIEENLRYVIEIQEQQQFDEKNEMRDEFESNNLV